MLLNGVNHVAIPTSDTDRLHQFYRRVFDATVARDGSERPGVRMSIVDIGPHTQPRRLRSGQRHRIGAADPPGTPAPGYVT